MPPEFAIFILITFPDTHGGFHRAFACTTCTLAKNPSTFSESRCPRGQLREMADALQATGE